MGTRKERPSSVSVYSTRGGNFREHGPADQAILFQALECGRQHLLGDVTNFAAEFVEPQRAILNELKLLGVRIALDDLGTGYSSLAYLRRFPFDNLKIDRSFVSDRPDSPQSLAVVRAIIGLGKSFSAVVTAEGVETFEQFALLGLEGCHQCQGYLLGTRLPL